MRVWLLCAGVLLAGCRQQELDSSIGALRIAPAQINFGTVYTGRESRVQTFKLFNDGRARQTLQWQAPDAPFHVSLLPSEAAPGEVEVVVSFVPEAGGKFTGELQVGAADQDPLLVLTLLGEGQPVPVCTTTEACTESAFDLVTRKCVEVPSADGTSCGGNACLINPTCQAGRCIGAEIDCSDNNLCTVDTCNAVIGCEHLPAPPCPGDGKCQVGLCNPATGCGMEDAVDGTACGPVQTCQAADVCIAGACVLRDPPDGYVCAEASPCQAQGICQSDACVRPPASVLTPDWVWDSAQVDAGSGVAPELHDMMLEENGALSLSGFFSVKPRLRVNTPGATDAKAGSARRCMLWNQRMVCADYPSQVNGKVAMIDMATGETKWTFDLHTARPDFLALTSTLFMARMAVQGSDRLAALFEAYPRGLGPGTECRLYFLVVLDASGKLVTAQQLKDPVLSQCDHPHPYGFGADAIGDLFVSFSPTISSPAPLVPGTPTVVMSFTRDGIFRWKFTDTALIGGELAVAQGLLYPENGATAVLTANGQPAFTLAEPFGRAVVSKTRTIVAPVIGGAQLRGYESGTNSPRWQHLLEPGQSFSSDQLRLASWSTSRGPTTVALTFTTGSSKTQLHGIVTRDGSKAFTCDVAMGVTRSEPLMFEVANGKIAVMDGTDACGKCDPPFAGSSAAFRTIRVPLISTPSSEPWIGTFGGAGHDHREETVNDPVVSQ